jgi:hypothetical protein
MQCAHWPIVAIRWLDSSSPRTGWTRLAEWNGVGSLECVSVGFLVAEDGISKTVSPHLAYPDDREACQGNGIIVIPVGAITSIETLATSSSAAPCVVPGHSFGRQEFAPPSS